ncbi:FtsX-like permease family protein [Ciceribacter sp. L1K23]|uniref:ABC transporter permease n=1 Tax=Ciceribacter sp. L1K23 TaxID=2820276 RepID=UPI001B844DA7|nr:FtsX-like permease family protein [Ciceribacter sp. L1K23]MBR0554470.1 FtsX-like permease family protein [Ciceribacter sp. L1K23]
MRSLDKKLLRDIWRLKMQVLAIALVIASGAALLVMALTTVQALQETTTAYYERSRFADVFADAKRVPQQVLRDIAAIPGVAVAESRIVKGAILDIADFDEPALGQVMSLPSHGPQLQNVLVVRSGRLPEPGKIDEVALSESFAEAHQLVPGDTFAAILGSQKRTLHVVGTVLSPEFVYAIAPGGMMPDDERFGLMWMDRGVLEASFDMKQAFNSVTLTLLRGADSRDVVARLNTLLGPYGGSGAYAREDQISNWFLQSEIEQQINMSRIMPTTFLAVAAFLTNMVMARLIQTERREIGLLKAFGYSNGAIGWHYAKMTLTIAVIGVVMGWALGAWLGHWNTTLYASIYRFPFLLYRPGPQAFLIAGGVSLAAALVGSLTMVMRAVRLPPAEAMLPPSPPAYSRSSAAFRMLDEPTRIILRRITRWPMRAGLTTLGLAMSIAVLVLALQWADSITYLARSVFETSQRQDATIIFGDAEHVRVETDVRHLPAVLSTEPFRSVAAEISNGNRVERQGIVGLPTNAVLSPIYDNERGVLPPAGEGLVMSSALADLLDVGIGDRVRIRVLEGRRATLDLPVIQTFETFIGTPVYMEINALNRLMGDGHVLTGVHVLLDDVQRQELLSRLKDLPGITAILFRQAALDTFFKTMGETIFIFIGFFVVFSIILSFGVSYNSIRIALSERSRELATLAVLGFSRWEISYILLGEIGLLAIASIPLGGAIGYLLSWYMASAFETELYRIPLVIQPSTFGQAALIGLASVIACAAVVRRRLDRLDLIGVLKTRE